MSLHKRGDRGEPFNNLTLPEQHIIALRGIMKKPCFLLLVKPLPRLPVESSYPRADFTGTTKQSERSFLKELAKSTLAADFLSLRAGLHVTAFIAFPLTRRHCLKKHERLS